MAAAGGSGKREGGKGGVRRARRAVRPPAREAPAQCALSGGLAARCARVCSLGCWACWRATGKRAAQPPWGSQRAREWRPRFYGTHYIRAGPPRVVQRQWWQAIGNDPPGLRCATNAFSPIALRCPPAFRPHPLLMEGTSHPSQPSSARLDGGGADNQDGYAAASGDHRTQSSPVSCGTHRHPDASCWLGRPSLMPDRRIALRRAT